MGGKRATQRIPVVYKIENLVNGKIYVGGAIDFHKRRWEHLHALKHGNHYASRLQRDWDTFGEDSFEFVILEKVDLSNCKTRQEKLYKIKDTEQKYFNELKPFRKRGYNKCDKARGGHSYIKKKLRLAASKAAKGENNRHFNPEKLELYNFYTQEDCDLTRYELAGMLQSKATNKHCAINDFLNKRNGQLVCESFVFQKDKEIIKKQTRYKIFILFNTIDLKYYISSSTVIRKKIGNNHGLYELLKNNKYKNWQKISDNYDQIISLLKSANITDLTQIYDKGLIISQDHDLFEGLKNVKNKI